MPSPHPQRVPPAGSPLGGDELGGGDGQRDRGLWLPEAGHETGPDARIAALAARQRGVVTYAQLLAAGLTPEGVKGRVRKGVLHRLHRSVYAVGHTALPALGSETAALLAIGGGAALSRPTALGLWRLPGAEDDGAIHVTVPPGVRRRSRAGIVVHKTTDLPRGDVRRVQGLPVTSPERTILDVAPSLSPIEQERLVAEAERRGLVRRASLRRRATGVLADVLDDGPSFTRSEAERRLLALVRAAELPRPDTNAVVAGFEADAVWWEPRVIVEVDGYRDHHDRLRFERDRRRGVAYAQAGFAVIRITWRQLVDRPHTVVAALAVALRARVA
jgi:very-short-patch-repair endonuclease